MNDQMHQVNLTDMFPGRCFIGVRQFDKAIYISAVPLEGDAVGLAHSQADDCDKCEECHPRQVL